MKSKYSKNVALEILPLEVFSAFLRLSQKDFLWKLFSYPAAILYRKQKFNNLNYYFLHTVYTGAF